MIKLLVQEPVLLLVLFHAHLVLHQDYLEVLQVDLEENVLLDLLNDVLFIATMTHLYAIGTK